MSQNINGQRSSRRAQGPRDTVVRTAVDSMFRAFADHTRLRILWLLRDGPLCVGDLVEILGAPQPTVSRHLAYLRRSGFVEPQQHGLWMFYELAPARNALHEQLLECLPIGARLLPEVNADAELARTVRRSGGCCPEGRRLMEQFHLRRNR